MAMVNKIPGIVLTKINRKVGFMFFTNSEGDFEVLSGNDVEVIEIVDAVEVVEKS
mgnify:CR=1 FL=1